MATQTQPSPRNVADAATYSITREIAKKVTGSMVITAAPATQFAWSAWVRTQSYGLRGTYGVLIKNSDHHNESFILRETLHLEALLTHTIEDNISKILAQRPNGASPTKSVVKIDFTSVPTTINVVNMASIPAAMQKWALSPVPSGKLGVVLIMRKGKLGMQIAHTVPDPSATKK